MPVAVCPASLRVASFIGALDLEAQKGVAGKIQTLLLDETPLLFTYFYDFMSASKKGASGIEVTAMSHLFLKDAKVG